MNNILLMFVVLNIANVIIQTVKSITTVKCGKLVAALVNALAYGLYTFVVIAMTIDGLNIWVKAGIIAACNFVGVYGVKWVEEKSARTRLWKIESTFPITYDEEVQDIKIAFDGWGIPNSYIEVGPNVIFNLYCYTKEQTAHAKQVIFDLDGKYFVSEARTSLL